MIIENFNTERRSKHVTESFDLVVAGGGLTGVCAAISAARKGLKVALIQDRPVLGGAGSSEIRVWMLGATSHMGNNNRWAREGGIVDEILVENTFRNKEGNPVLFDMVLIDKVRTEKNISLFLNTVIYNITKSDERNIESIQAYTSSAETKYTFKSKLFCDSTGDGLVGYLAGATYRIGAEDKAEFNEKFAPDKELYGDKLGSSLLFYFKDAEKPISYIAPDFAMKKEDVEKEIHRINNPNYFNPMKQDGCKYWWIEYGGRIDTIHDNEEIKFKLWSVAYGIWDYIKNSGKFPEAANKTLEWVGLIPGKRESRRFVGPYMMTQQDVVEQKSHYDVVAFGGWSIDLHPADGVFSKKDACSQWHSKGVFQIPYRCYITEDLDNLLYGGRLLSASHVAFGATRVMLTSGLGGEVVGAAAAVCLQEGYTPIQLAEKDKIVKLQKMLIETGNYLPQMDLPKLRNLMNDARITVSSELELSTIPFDGEWRVISHSTAQMIPLKKGKAPSITVNVRAQKETDLKVELRVSAKYFNHTPDTVLDTKVIKLAKGEQKIKLDFAKDISQDCYAFICFMTNEDVELQFSEYRITGILTVFNKIMPAVSNWGKQTPTGDIGIDEFEFWCPERRPDGQNIAMNISPAIQAFNKENLHQLIYRPIEKTNAWVASFEDHNPTINLEWNEIQTINTITLFADSDYDQPMETVQWGHCDARMPFCVDQIEVFDDKNNLVKSMSNNYKTQVKIVLEDELKVRKLTIKLGNSSRKVPVSLFSILIK